MNKAIQYAKAIGLDEAVVGKDRFGAVAESLYRAMKTKNIMVLDSFTCSYHGKVTPCPSCPYCLNRPDHANV